MFNQHINGAKEKDTPVVSLFLTFLSQSDGEGNGTPLQYSCLENPKDGGA